MDYNRLRAVLSRRFSLPRESDIQNTLSSFTVAEKSVFYFFVAIFVLSGVILLWKVNSSFLVEVPSPGGTLTEGVIGNPRFINPVLAISEADKNLTSLIYSGLLKISADGVVENDLASELIISENDLVYTLRINEEATFHDGQPVTADDVIFTIQKITDPLIKSPRRGNWDGVTISKIDDHTVSFSLKSAYAPFIYNLTTGILPKHIWKNVSAEEFSFSQFNTLPIGSGPYKVIRVERNSGGIPDFYKLSPFNNVLGQKPYIENLIFKFYPSETELIEAYDRSNVESISGVSPNNIEELKIGNAQVAQAPLPRVFAVFFNQDVNTLFRNKEVRRALNLATPKEKVIESVLGGYGVAIDGPLPAGLYSWTSNRITEDTYEERFVNALETLTDNGWELNEETGVLEKGSGSAKISLSFSISTGDVPELRAVANELITAWEKLGAQVDLLVFETGDLNQNVIRPRQFDTLLFGEVVGRDSDLFPFWHSSQRTDPGLNIALYANNQADTYLEKARSSSDPNIVEASYKSFALELENDIPAVFLYTPNFLYIVPNKIHNMNLGTLTVSQDRFLGIRDWYIEMDKVCKIFID